MSISEFIDFLYYVGLSKFRGKAYFNMDTIIPKVEETFPVFNEKLYIQDRIDLLEDATANCGGDEKIAVLGTKVINQLIDRKLVSKFRKKADNNSYITYKQKNVYREGKRIKFITYSWEPNTTFGIREVGTSMSPMNLRDMILEEE